MLKIAVTYRHSRIMSRKCIQVNKWQSSRYNYIWILIAELISYSGTQFINCAYHSYIIHRLRGYKYSSIIYKVGYMQTIITQISCVGISMERSIFVIFICYFSNKYYSIIRSNMSFIKIKYRSQFLKRRALKNNFITALPH